MEFLNRSGGARHPCEQGFVLMITLVIMTIMALGTVAVIRSMNNTNIIAGNYAFKQAALQVADRGVSDAFHYLGNLSDGNASQANRYFNVRQTNVDAQSVPLAIDWATVDCRDQANFVCNADTAYQIRYYVERQCAVNPDLADARSIKASCDYEVVSNNPEVLAIRYRIIVRVEGPRGTVSLVEVMASGPP